MRTTKTHFDLLSSYNLEFETPETRQTRAPLRISAFQDLQSTCEILHQLCFVLLSLLHLFQRHGSTRFRVGCLYLTSVVSKVTHTSLTTATYAHCNAIRITPEHLFKTFAYSLPPLVVLILAEHVEHASRVVFVILVPLPARQMGIVGEMQCRGHKPRRGYEGLRCPIVKGRVIPFCFSSSLVFFVSFFQAKSGRQRCFSIRLGGGGRHHCRRQSTRGSCVLPDCPIAMSGEFDRVFQK
jgi:hypothetical protein